VEKRDAILQRVQMGSKKIKRPTKAGKSRMVKLDAETLEIIERQQQAFREKFGREPGPRDPLFFDPDADTPQPFSLARSLEESTQAMRMAGIRPEVIYAHRKTGLIVTADNRDKLSKEAVAEWETAIDEYFDKGKGKSL
jgi:hypothetical protein